jgi:hypothetical protein
MNKLRFYRILLAASLRINSKFVLSNGNGFVDEVVTS